MNKEFFGIDISGTSHGEDGIHVYVKGVPEGIELDMDFIDQELKRRRPGQVLTTPRQENDDFEIINGLNRGDVTNGNELVVHIPNTGHQSRSYDKLDRVLRPGHGITPLMLKYHDVEFAGGGAASARLTAGFVAVGAIAQLGLEQQVNPDIQTISFISSLSGYPISYVDADVSEEDIYASAVRCPDPKASRYIEDYLEELQEEGDSIGAEVRTVTKGYPGGIGERHAHSLDSQLMGGIGQINGVKGVIIGEDPFPSQRLGSMYVDEIIDYDGQNLITATNSAGGILGGYSTSGDIVTNTHFKPTSSIKKPVRTVDLDHNPVTIELGDEDRHDPCIAIRGTEVVKAMQRIVLYRAWLNQLDY